MTWQSRGVAFAACGILFLITTFQFAYRNQMVEVQTRRGLATVYPVARDEYVILEREFKPGDFVFIMPEPGPAGVLSDLRNPTSYNALLPVICAPRQLQQAVDDLEAKGRPPIVWMTMRLGSTIEGIQKQFGPSAFMDEFHNNPMKDYLETHYEIVLQEGPVVIRKAKKQP